MHGLARTSIACGALGLTAFLFTGCTGSNSLAERTAMAQAGILSERPSSTGTEFGRLYRYYPDQQVYYSAFQDAWFFQNGTRWERNTHLPSSISVDQDRVVVIELFTSDPTEQHLLVAQTFPESGALPESRFAFVPDQY